MQASQDPRDSSSISNFNSSGASAFSALHSNPANTFFSPSSPTHSTSNSSSHSHTSHLASSHASTMDSHATTQTQDTETASTIDEMDGASCEYDPDAWFARFNDTDEAEENFDSHVLPTTEQLDKAANIPVYDADGVSRPFKSLYHGSEHIGQRQLIIFIRHFYCFGCAAYLQKLTETITPSAYFSLPTPTTITVIGCGMPHLIPRYTTNTTCPFRIYADPTRKLYRALGMHMTVQYGARPGYMPKNSAWEMTVKSLMPAVKAKRRDKLAGGNLLQVGGEFLFEDGEPAWCRRMQTYRDHTEMRVLRHILEMDDEIPVVQEATAVALRPQRQTSQQSTPARQERTSSLLPHQRRQEALKVMPAMGPTETVMPDKHRGLKLVWDGNGVSASLQRESRIPEEDVEELSRQMDSFYQGSEFAH